MSFFNVEPAVPRELFREAAPLHYLFQVESFSLLSTNSIVKYESNDFEAGGLKWKVLLYPDGNKKENGHGHVSLYLQLVDTSFLPACWEVNVFFRLFLFDQFRDRYLVHGDTEGRVRRFHALKMYWGFPQFVSHQKFKDISNGYLVDDTCMFGAEVFISKPAVNCERLSMLEVECVHYTWKIENFSQIKEKRLTSDVFIAGNQNWTVGICPKGESIGKDNYVSLYLNSASCKNTTGLRIYAEYVLRLKDQIHGNHEKVEDKDWFSESSQGLVWTKFIELNWYNERHGKGFLGERYLHCRSGIEGPWSSY